MKDRLMGKMTEYWTAVVDLRDAFHTNNGVVAPYNDRVWILKSSLAFRMVKLFEL